MPNAGDLTLGQTRQEGSEQKGSPLLRVCYGVLERFC